MSLRSWSQAGVVLRLVTSATEQVSALCAIPCSQLQTIFHLGDRFGPGTAHWVVESRESGALMQSPATRIHRNP